MKEASAGERLGRLQTAFGAARADHEWLTKELESERGRLEAKLSTGIYAEGEGTGGGAGPGQDDLLAPPRFSSESLVRGSFRGMVSEVVPTVIARLFFERGFFRGLGLARSSPERRQVDP